MHIPRPRSISPEESAHSERREFRLSQGHNDLLKAFAIVDRTTLSCQIHGALAAASHEWEKGKSGLYAPQPFKYRESTQLVSMMFTQGEKKSIGRAESLWNTDEGALICGAVAGYLHERRANPALKDAVNRYRHSRTHGPR